MPTARLLIALAFLGVLAACEQKPAPPAAASAGHAGAVDWASVRAPSDPAKQMEGLTQLARLADAWHQGATVPIRLTFVAPASVGDGSGRTAAFSPEAWKGAVLTVRSSKGPAAARALPGNAHHYADGLGKVRRHAYTASVEGDGTIAFTPVKPLGDESEG